MYGILGVKNNQGLVLKKRQFIKDLNVKDSVNSVFLVKYLSVMESRDGKNYLNIILSDSTGDMEARKWHGAIKVVEKVSRGDLVAIQGKVNFYQNKMQLIVSEIVPMSEEDFNREDFYRKSDNNIDKMFEQLVEISLKIEDVYLKELVTAILFDSEISSRIKRWSAAKSIHHAYEGGLLEHLLSCAQLGDMISTHYGVNKSFVLAGTILHDICKIYELTDGPLVEYSDEGKLIGHISKSVELIDRFAIKVKDFPIDTKTHLKHIILSHHGEYEYGSPKLPQTTEALLVHHIDLIDSKLNTMELAKKQDRSQGNWTTFIKSLDRSVYKTDLPEYKSFISLNDMGEELNRSDNTHDSSLSQNLSDKLKGFKL